MVKSKEKLLIGACILLAIFAEICLFEDSIGISYSMFIAAFYFVFFFKVKKHPFTHKQIGTLLFCSIWLLAISYVLYANPIFNLLNFIVIPILVLTHTVLVTSPKSLSWHSIAMISLLKKKIYQTIKRCNVTFAITGRKVKRNMDESTYRTGKKIGIGILISLPLLFVITFLLSAADAKFGQLLSSIPQKMINLNFEYIWRGIKIFMMAIIFFCYLKVVAKKTVLIGLPAEKQEKHWDTIIVTTILIFMNITYLLFTIVQFQYFFSGTLEEGLSYSEYARRGFFELMLVSVINYVVLISAVMKNKQSIIIKVLLTMLIGFTGVMLVSAFLRLSMYEEAYGFTYLRVLVHSFMIYLLIVFVFTLVKTWINRLSLTRFYLLSSLLFYIGLNIVGIDNMIVSKNIERYEQTGKLDIGYLRGLSYSVIPELVDLYEENPNIPGLKQLLDEKESKLTTEKQSWQSYNLPREHAKKVLQ